MMNIKVNGEIIKNVIGFELCRTHGLSDIIDKGSVKIYKGFYNGNYFEIENIFDNGCDDYELLKYKELYTDVKISEEIEELIDFINNSQVLYAYYNSKITYYGRINKEE